MSAARLCRIMDGLADPAIAAHSQRFFKTGKGEYAQGDQFLGIRVPPLRTLANKFRTMELSEIQRLLDSKFHERRLCALFILIHRFDRANADQRKEIADFYLNNTHNINNWDLVDSSAYKILGKYLLDQDRKILYRLCQSENLWERRIAIITTLQFIKSGQYADTLKLAEMLISDEHDLIHKAAGWMLREVGKRDLAVQRQFLEKHYKRMPRTMLRSAIENLPEVTRRQYLNAEI